MFVLVVPKHIAHKMVKTSYFVSQKAFIIFQKFQHKTKTKKNHKKHEKLQHFELKNSITCLSRFERSKSLKNV